MAYKLAKDERELIIRRSEADGHFDVWADSGLLRRLVERKGWRHTAEGEGFYQIPLDSVRILSRTRKRRVISEEGRQEAARRFSSARKTVQSGKLGEMAKVAGQPLPATLCGHANEVPRQGICNCHKLCYCRTVSRMCPHGEETK